MSLFLAKSFSSSTYEFAKAQADVISISRMDTGIGFNEANPVTIEGATCVPVTYTRSQTGPTAVRLERLVHDTGFTSPRQIIVLGAPSGTIMPNGIDVSSVAGEAWNIGDTGAPFASHISLIYDTGDCHGTGHWVDKAGGGTTSFPPDVILYHELAHCFHFATGVTTSEPLAETDENDMRDARGLPHRNTASHNGGCGGGPTTCCIVATLATGSPYSVEIQRFRYFRENTLRQSMVGDDYFNELYYRYYGFSPEVTRLMGHEPRLSPLIKDWFVMPLLAAVEMLIYYADNRGIGLAKFLHTQSTREGLSDIFQKDFLDELSVYLKMIRISDSQDISLAVKDKARKYPGFDKLLLHINRETLKDEYINWSLLSVVELWVESGQLLHDDRPDTEIDSEIYEKIGRWLAHLPVSKIWGEFSRLQTEIELQNLEQFLFDSRFKELFAERLMKIHSRHGDTIRRWAKR